MNDAAAALGNNRTTTPLLSQQRMRAEVMNALHIEECSNDY